MPPAYEVLPYSIDTLRALLAKKAGTPLHVLALKQHLHYFREYFAEIGARTIVVEDDYVDRDYLEDYAAYYVRCFQPYARHCARLHFFNAAFTEAEFAALLRETDATLTPERLQEAYLGFIVVKPLPKTIIGRTCLKTYPADGRRQFPITRPYPAHLFGVPLVVDSLAFQEQDTVAAACATSALWAAFQGTGRQFQHPIPSPVEITRAATAHVPLDTRTFPNSGGLNATQMADAIRSVGLEPFLVKAEDQYVLKSALYAYLRAQIPVLLGIWLVEASAPEEAQGSHAVTVTGYSLDETPPTPDTQVGTFLRAYRMNKIYVHDDQVGPFARMPFENDALLRTSALSEAGTLLYAKPRFLLVPLYHKIRIPLQSIRSVVFLFDAFVEALRLNEQIDLTQPLEWDVYLTSVNTLKAELRAAALSGEYRARVLTHPLPRFLWRATACVNGSPVLDLLFDATDIEQGCFYACVIEYETPLVQTLRAAAHNYVADDTSLPSAERRFFEWFAIPTF